MLHNPPRLRRSPSSTEAVKFLSSEVPPARRVRVFLSLSFVLGVKRKFHFHHPPPPSLRGAGSGLIVSGSRARRKVECFCDLVSVRNCPWALLKVGGFFYFFFIPLPARVLFSLRLLFLHPFGDVVLILRGGEIRNGFQERSSEVEWRLSPVGVGRSLFNIFESSLIVFSSCEGNRIVYTFVRNLIFDTRQMGGCLYFPGE